MPTREQTTDLWPFSNRNSANIENDVEVLYGEPKFNLTEAERDAVTEFAHGLLRGIVTDVRVGVSKADTGDPIPFELISKIPATAGTYTFNTEYFATDQGAVDLEALIPDVTNTIEVHKFLADIVAEGNALDKKSLQNTDLHSSKWYAARYVKQLAQPPETDRDFHDPDNFAINTTPDALLDKLEGLKAYKTFYRRLHKANSQNGQPANEELAKNTLLEVHIAKVNSHLALLYPLALDLSRQLDVSTSTKRVETWRRRLLAAVPVLCYAFSNHAGSSYNSEFTADFTRRLDLVRNGAAVSESGGNYSSVQPTLSALTDYTPKQDYATIEPHYEAQQVENMRNRRWDAAHFKPFLEAVLEDMELLSGCESTWEEAAERTGPAVDGRWQVIISPKVSSLSVNGSKHIMFVPEDYGRAAIQISPPGSLVVGAHETVHVLQNDADVKLAEELPLAKFKGRRNLTIREMAGINEERIVLGAVGMQRPIRLSYLMGMRAKLAGGNKAEVIRAVYDARYRGEDTESDDERTKKMAVDQAERLYRHGGNNSQPLDYLEQELIMQKLARYDDEKVRAVSIAASSFSLADSAALHAVDLLRLPDSTKLHSPAATVLKVYMDRFQDG